MRSGVKILGILVMALLLQSTMVTCLAEQQPPPKIPVRVKGQPHPEMLDLKSIQMGGSRYPDISQHLVSRLRKPRQPSPITPPTSVDMSRSLRIGS